MKMKPTISMLAVLGLAAVVTAAAGAAILASAGSSKQAAVVIRHQTRGCHSWSVNGDAYKASQTVAIRRGGSISVTNNDVMPHQLVKTNGPVVTFTRAARGMGMGLKGTFAPAMLARMGAAVKITFSQAGTYKFITKAGEDYMKGMKTIGEDNLLRLTVVVR